MSRSPRPNPVGSTPYVASSVLTLQVSARRPQPRSRSMPSPSVYMTVSRSGQTLSPWIQRSSAVLAMTVTVTSAGAVRPGSRPVSIACRRPWRKRAPPIPPESTVMLCMRIPCRTGASRRLSAGRGSAGGEGAIADPGLTSGVRQACNSHSVVHGLGSFLRGSWAWEQYRVERASAVRELFLLDGDAEEAGWQDRALCAQTDPEAFFPEKGGSTREAKKVCLTCEVRDDCLESALMNDERFGIWGGLSERERRKLKKRAV